MNRDHERAAGTAGAHLGQMHQIAPLRAAPHRNGRDPFIAGTTPEARQPAAGQRRRQRRQDDHDQWPERFRETCGRAVREHGCSIRRPRHTLNSTQTEAAHYPTLGPHSLFPGWTSDMLRSSRPMRSYGQSRGLVGHRQLQSTAHRHQPGETTLPGLPARRCDGFPGAQGGWRDGARPRLHRCRRPGSSGARGVAGFHA